MSPFTYKQFYDRADFKIGKKFKKATNKSQTMKNMTN